MALSSPGAQITIIDQSQYLPAASNSVPLLVIATATNKADASGVNVATATTSTNANKLFQVTSQRDLVSLYGNPFFYKTTTGTPIQGYELNEYGLMAAYSLLGVTNSCFVLRADIDLAELVGKLGRPVGEPANNTYWLDTTNSTWGIHEFNSSTGKFVYKTPIVIDSGSGSATPNSTLGNIGDYAVNTVQKSKPIDPLNQGTYFKKTINNEWVRLGSQEWKNSVPTVEGSIQNPVLTGGHVFTMTITNSQTTFDTEVTVPGSPYNTAQGVATTINNLDLGAINASEINGKLCIYSTSTDSATRIRFSTGDDVLSDLGIENGDTLYWQPDLVYGNSSKMPLWTVGQAIQRPTGSVWIKTGSLGKGASLSLSTYSTTLGSFKSVDAPLYPTIFEATTNLDSSGGQYIPANTVCGNYSFFNTLADSPIYLYKRRATGPTVVTGTVRNPTFSSSARFSVAVTTSNSNNLTTPIVVTLPTGSPEATDFVAAWTAANIPNTSIKLTDDGLIQLTHTLGGDIVVDVSQATYSSSVLTNAGFIADVTSGCLVGFNTTRTYLVNQNSTTGSGDNGSFSISVIANNYVIVSASGGINYAVGDFITIEGSQLGGQNGDNDLVLKVVSVDNSNAVTGVTYSSGEPQTAYSTVLSNWELLTYTSSTGAPNKDPIDGTYWFYSTVNQVDIMVNQQGQWKGYKNVNYNNEGHPIITGTNGTDPNGPIISANAPTTQTTGSALVYGDLWIDSNDLENYPVISRWQSVNSVDQWVLIDNTDQVSSNGIVFADARWATENDVDPISDTIPTIGSLLVSDYLDLDAPDATTYPQGTLLFNTRRSGYNVKQFRQNYFNGINFPDQSLPDVTNAWVSASGLKGDGSAYMGRKAQRHMVVQAMKAAIGTNMSIREEESFFNLIAAPNYPELQPDMIALNNERNNTAYIIGDTPLRLNDQATNLTNWANNVANADSTGEDGLVSRNEYLGIFYPSGIATDLTGASVVVPASHMMLRTFIRNDQIAYPWLAAAGTRRGNVDNATNIGYLDGNTGEFQVIKNRVGIRDVLYTHQINPIAFFTNVGLLNYGNKSSKDTQSSMDRTNVARLVAYIRERLQVVARPFIFEPNDSLTRSQLTSVVQTLFVDLVSKRGLYDFLVVCDNSNNTTDRIDRNELWIDIAIEPVKAAEFIYIPVRILKTGDIAKLS